MSDTIAMVHHQQNTIYIFSFRGKHTQTENGTLDIHVILVKLDLKQV